MAGSIFDSALYSGLFPTGDVGRLFTDAAEIRAMLLVEGALAQVQGARGTIPAESAAAIARAVIEVQIDPASLSKATATNGVSVPGLVAAFRKEMQAPEHAQYVHWGATSQDIADTGLMLRLRQSLALIEADLRAVLKFLSDLAESHAELPVAARTYGQHATPTSFGAIVAGWGNPVLSLLRELDNLRRDCLIVSLSGAAGTSSELGDDPTKTRAELAADLGLSDPGRVWHTDRTPVLRVSDWMTRVALALGKLGEDVTLMTQTGIAEVSLSGGGGSSTMPQKQNPVIPAALVALARQTAGQHAILQTAAMPRNQRDGSAWFTEWMCLPQVVLGTCASVLSARRLCQAIAPDAGNMAANLAGGLGMIHSEALSFALTRTMSRPDAQAAVKALCKDAMQSGTSLRDLVEQTYPEIDTAMIFDPARQMGQAPEEARGFARGATDLLSTET